MHKYLKDKYLKDAAGGDPLFSKEKFLWADFAFFLKWWKTDTDDETKSDMKKLV